MLLSPLNSGHFSCESRVLEEGVPWHPSPEKMKFQVLRNVISTILRQSQNVLISHFLKLVVTWSWTFIIFKRILIMTVHVFLYIFLQVFGISYFNLGGFIEWLNPPLYVDPPQHSWYEHILLPRGVLVCTLLAFVVIYYSLYVVCVHINLKFVFNTSFCRPGLLWFIISGSQVPNSSNI